MSEFLAVLLVKNSQDNPEGLPDEWHRDARSSGPVLDQSLAILGYQLMTADEFAQRQLTYAAEYDAWRSAVVRVPDEVLLYQFRASVTLAGLKDAVDSAIAALPEPAKTVANEKWEYGNTVRRNHPMIVSLGAAIGQTPTQIDDIFRTAATIQ